jgi:hypothetical protein
MPVSASATPYALGGLGSRAGSASSTSSPAAVRPRVGDAGGRPVRIEQAQGILIAALGVLPRYYRYECRAIDLD